jgi:hypothetical protein
MNTNQRFILGVILLVIGLILPLGAFLVPQTNWPTAVKAAVSGILFFGFEIMAVPAAAVMGKENFERIASRVKTWLRMLKPVGSVGRVRHSVGLVFFLLPLVPTYIMAYVPALLPDASPARLWVNIGSDAMFLASLFILGGDFWDKLRSLFVREARAVFPEKKVEKAGHLCI